MILKTLQKLILVAVFLGLGTASLRSQITMGSGNEPQSFSILQLDGTSGGLRLNQLTTDQRNALTVEKNDLSKGLTIFNITTNEIELFDGINWIKLVDGNSVSWNSVATKQGATSNFEDIYQIGSVGIGTTTPNANALLDVSSTTKGVLFPRMTNEERNKLTADVANGLFIYNTTTNCFNYYEGRAAKWVSMCGSYDPAKMVIAGCGDAAVGPQGGSLTQSKALSADVNTYAIFVNVVEAGTYNILVKTDNGYSYQATGTFLNPSNNEKIVLKGQGVPQRENAIVGDAVTVDFNGVGIVLPDGCVLPNVTVLPSATTIDLDGDITVNGDYYVATDFDGNIQYVDVPIAVTSGGALSITTNSINGFNFSSGAITIDKTTKTIRLYPQGGKPLLGGLFTYEFNIPGRTTKATFNVPVSTKLGTFDFPAKSCLAILTEDPTKTDAEYWVQAAGGSQAAAKTFCDMTNGGYTLIWSYSEKTSYSIYAPVNDMESSNKQLTTDLPYNVAKTQTDVINYYNYRLAKATMQNTISSAAGTGQYRVRIAYNPTDMKDAWGVNNYFTAVPTKGTYDYINSGTSGWQYPGIGGNNGAGNGIPFQGKIFGLVVDGTKDPMTYNGVYAGLVGPYFGNTGYSVHWDAGGRFTSATLTVDMPMSGGGTTRQTFNPNTFNNLFGFFGETEGNHLFGKCTSDDYGFSSPTQTCGAGNLKPHSFNGGEGRVLQWFVK